MCYNFKKDDGEELRPYEKDEETEKRKQNHHECFVCLILYLRGNASSAFDMDVHQFV